MKGIKAWNNSYLAFLHVKHNNDFYKRFDYLKWTLVTHHHNFPHLLHRSTPTKSTSSITLLTADRIQTQWPIFLCHQEIRQPEDSPASFIVHWITDHYATSVSDIINHRTIALPSLSFLRHTTTTNASFVPDSMLRTSATLSTSESLSSQLLTVPTVKQLIKDFAGHISIAETVILITTSPMNVSDKSALTYLGDSASIVGYIILFIALPN
jgi:hypothetical protein